MIIISFLLMFMAVGSQFYRLNKTNQALIEAEKNEDHREVEKLKKDKVIFTVTTILFFTASLIMVIYVFSVIG